MLDITHLGSAEKTAERWLKDLPALDLDDDLYLFEQENEEIRIWEFYQIHSDMPRVIQDVGFWRDDISLEITKPSKWLRRKDLRVRLLLFVNFKAIYL